MEHIKTDDTVIFTANFYHPASGFSIASDTLPQYLVYEDTTGAAILNGAMAARTDHVGSYYGSFTASAANGFDSNSFYDIQVSGQVGGIEGIASVKQFVLDDVYDANVVQVSGQYVIPKTIYDANIVQVSGEYVDQGSLRADSGQIADAVWDEVLTAATHNISTSAGRRLREVAGDIIWAGTCQAGSTANTIVLDTGASSVDGSYDPSAIAIVGGVGAGQSRLILSYTGASRTATVDRNWRVTPDATSEFVISNNPGREHVNEGSLQGATINTATLNTSASAYNDAYNGQLIFLRSGDGEDQVRLITDYNGTSKVATVARDWDSTPNTTTGYVILPYHDHEIRDANMVQISGAVDTLRNFGYTYDGTGYGDDYAPAQQQQLNNLANVGSAVNTAPVGVNIVVGTPTNDYTDTAALDGTYHTIVDVTDNTDFDYVFNVGTDGIPASIKWTGYANLNGDSYQVYASGSAGWEQIGSIDGASGSTNVVKNFDTLITHKDSSGAVRIRFLSTDGQGISTDQILCAYSVVNRSVGYADGAVWIDTINGIAGTTAFINGTADNPVNSLSSAYTLANSIGIKRFRIVGGSDITLDQAYEHYSFLGDCRWDLDLGEQDIEGMYVKAAAVSGSGYISAGQIHTPIFDNCILGNDSANVYLPYHEAINCKIYNPNYNIVVSSGITIWDKCVSAVAGNETPTIAFGDQWVDFNCRGYMGGLTYKDMVDGNRSSFDCPAGQIVIDSSCTGGALRRAGWNRYRDNSGGAITVTDGYGMTIDTNAYGEVVVSGVVDANVVQVSGIPVDTDGYIDVNVIQVSGEYVDIGSFGGEVDVTASLTSYDVATRSHIMAVSGSVLDVNVVQVSGEQVSINDFVGSASSLTASDIRIEMDSNSVKLTAISGDVSGLAGAAMRGTDNAALASDLESVSGVMVARTRLDADYFDWTTDPVSVSGIVDANVIQISGVYVDLTDTAIDANVVQVSGEYVSINDFKADVSNLDADIYFANIKYIKDSTNLQDEFGVQWFKNDQPVSSGQLTSPAISVYNTITGEPVITNQLMTYASVNLGVVRYDNASVMTSGEPYLVETSGVIDSSTRTWKTIVGLDV